MGSAFVKATNGIPYCISNGQDIRDEKTFIDAIEGADLVIHAAAIRRGGSIKEMIDVNINGTASVMNCCLKKKIPLKIISSSESLRPWASSYASTKFLIEKMASEVEGLRLDCFRIPTLIESQDNILRFWKKSNPIVYFYSGVPRHLFFIGVKEAVEFCLSEGAGNNEFIYPKVSSYNLAKVAQVLFGRFDMVEKEGTPHESLSAEYTTKNAPVASEDEIIKKLHFA